MATPARGYTQYGKEAQFLLTKEEIWVDGQWVAIKRVVVKRGRILIRLAGGRRMECEPSAPFHVRRPAQWIGPRHTGKSWGMPPGAGQG